MSKPIIRIHNQETDEIIDREMTDDEYTIYLQEQAEIEVRLEQENAKAIAKAELLNRLGITPEESALLIS